MEEIFNPSTFDTTGLVMTCLAPIVFIALHKVTAGYGIARTKAWGPAVNNRIGWILMEAPVFLAMLWIWISSPRRGETAPAIMASMFLIHYFQRSFLFPLMIKGKSRMPWAIVAMGITFNLVNAYLIGGWLFYMAPPDRYPVSWLTGPQFIIGTLLFFAGMAININSDHIVRNLRRPGDTRHYIPRGGMFRYVTSANYFGELTEWIGFAILTWSWPAAVFALWTFANLAPRARSLHRRYISEFGTEYSSLNRRYIIPFLY